MNKTSEVTISVEVDITVCLALTPGEAMALAQICGYGPDTFKEWFYKNLGKAYLERYEGHLDSLFAKSRKLEDAVHEALKQTSGISKIKIA